MIETFLDKIKRRALELMIVKGMGRVTLDQKRFRSLEFITSPELRGH